jgi:hypothetical protein
MHTLKLFREDQVRGTSPPILNIGTKQTLVARPVDPYPRHRGSQLPAPGLAPTQPTNITMIMCSAFSV